MVPSSPPGSQGCSEYTPLIGLLTWLAMTGAGARCEIYIIIKILLNSTLVGRGGYIGIIGGAITSCAMQASGTETCDSIQLGIITSSEAGCDRADFRLSTVRRACG
ncbi:hypothetical protein T492DRAFT_35692 [Pavlovales sp. CCMP2436]|nr:hypothetical protein T492DRAFT_35692 [Pavlovales sp. CCMP2436]